MVPQKIPIIPRVHHRLKEHPHHRPVPELLKPPVRRQHPSAHYPKPYPCHTLRQQIILRKQRLLIKPTQRPKDLAVEQHKHPSSKRLRHRPHPLHQIISRVQHIIKKSTFTTSNIRRRQMQSPSFHPPQRPAQQSGLRQFHIRIQKQHILRRRQPRTCISSHRRQSATDDFHPQSVAKSQRHLYRPIGRPGIRHQNTRRTHSAIILPAKRLQQPRQHHNFILRRNHYRQFSVHPNLPGVIQRQTHRPVREA